MKTNKPSPLFVSSGTRLLYLIIATPVIISILSFGVLFFVFPHSNSMSNSQVSLQTSTASPPTVTIFAPTATTPTTPTPVEPTIFQRTYKVIIKTEPGQIFSPNPQEKQSAVAQLNKELSSCFDAIPRGGTVAQINAMGFSPNPDIGIRMVDQVINQLPGDIAPKTPGGIKKIVGITLDPSLNGRVELELSYLNLGSAIPRFLGTMCTPPMASCNDIEGGQLVTISNWARISQNLIFYVDQEPPLEVKPAYGELRTVGCMYLKPGSYRWRAKVQDWEDHGVLNIVNGKSEQLVFCVKEQTLVHDCPGPLPPTPIFGSFPTPANP